MAFNLRTFKTRTLTAIIFAAVMLTGLLWNHWSFLVLFSIIHFGCWWEYFNLLEKIHNTTYHRYTRFGFMLIGYALMLWFCGPAYEINNYSLKENLSFPVSIAGFVFLVMGIFQKNNTSLKLFGIAALGLIYISLCWGLMMDLRSLWSDFEGEKVLQDFGYTIPILIISAIWINDTMAYIVGSFIGRTPLSKVSPKKTWEGTIGGVILSVLVVGFLFIKLGERDLVYSYIYNKYWFIIALIASIAGTIGDLFESKLKRMAGVKDSGSFMPGHGGFLDRFDSLLFAIPFVWLFVQFFLKFPMFFGSQTDF
jgi:phosphatidate cytidylyltransferase